MRSGFGIGTGISDEFYVHAHANRAVLQQSTSSPTRSKTMPMISPQLTFRFLFASM